MFSKNTSDPDSVFCIYSTSFTILKPYLNKNFSSAPSRAMTSPWLSTTVVPAWTFLEFRKKEPKAFNCINPDFIDISICLRDIEVTLRSGLSLSCGTSNERKCCRPRIYVPSRCDTKWIGFKIWASFLLMGTRTSMILQYTINADFITIVQLLELLEN